MIRSIDFENLPSEGLYMYEGIAVQVITCNTASQTIDCILVYRDGNSEPMNGVTMKQLQSKLCPFEDGVIKHKQFDKILTCLKCGKAVYLFGAAGTGKNVICQQLADELGLTFYFASSVQDRFDLIGYSDALGKYVSTEFYRAFTEGGLFMLDEMDNSCEDALITLNSALANGYITFPIHGRKEAHPNFKVIAAGNTCGKGANELYTGRRPLDAATLNRFVFVEVGYDKRIEFQIAKGNSEMVEFVHDLRDSSKKTGYPLVVSYRNLKDIMDLKQYFSMTECLEMCILKGMGADEVGVLYNGLKNKRNKFAEVLSDLYVTMDR